MNVDPIYHPKVLELRSLKDFAAICQFLHMFHPAFALNDFETEDLEQALVDPSAMAYLVDLQARMLRALTQNRHISFDNWIKYMQKEFENRAQDQNPWTEEDNVNYESFSLPTKLMILSNLCEWQLDDPDRFRSSLKTEEEVDFEWRVDPIGHDAFDRTYWLFDDNRLYRENPAPKKITKKSKQPTAPPPKAKAGPAFRTGTRRSGRGQKQEQTPEPEPEHETPPVTPGVDWEPVCITRQEWEEFPALFKRSKHPDEKALYTLITTDVLPKVLDDFKEKEKEREKLEAIANRKRSSRIVLREFEVQEKARLDAIRQQELQELAEQRKAELRERRAEKERQQQQQVRDNRLKEREQRLKAREDAIWEREEKKKQKAEKIAKEREERKNRRLVGGSHGKEDADEDESMNAEEEEEDWVFDCVCGVFGNNLDDGELMIACGKCNVWQHVACLKQEDAEQGRSSKDWASVDYICQRCIVKEEKKAQRKAKKLLKEQMAAQAMANGSSAPAIQTSPLQRKLQPAMIPNGHSSQTPAPPHVAYAYPPLQPASSYPNCNSTGTSFSQQYPHQSQQQLYSQQRPPPTYPSAAYPPNAPIAYGQGYTNGHSEQYLPAQQPPQPHQYHQTQVQPMTVPFGSHHQEMHPSYPAYSSFSPPTLTSTPTPAPIQAGTNHYHSNVPPASGGYPGVPFSSVGQPQAMPVKELVQGQEVVTLPSPAPTNGGSGQKRIHPDEEMERVERPPKMANV